MAQIKIYIAAAVMIGILGFAAYMFYQVGKKNEEIGTLSTTVATGEANNKTLRATTETLRSSKAATEKDFATYKELHSFSEDEIKRLQEEKAKSDSRSAQLAAELKKLKERGLTPDENKILESKIPIRLIDLSNAE